jgi:hypothetical protein
MLAGRAKIRRSDVDVDESGRRRVHVESVQARQSGRMVIAGGPPIRRQRRYPSVLLPYARADPNPNGGMLGTASGSASANCHALR